MLPNYLQMEHRFADIMARMGRNGIYLNKIQCEILIHNLQEKISEIDNQLSPLIPPKHKQLKPLFDIRKQNSEYKKHVQDWISAGKLYRITGKVMERWEVEPANLNSTDQLREYLLSIGWKPSDEFESWNYKQIKNKYGKLEKVKGLDGKYIRTSPKLPTDDAELEQLAKKSPTFGLIAQRVQIKHRLSTLEGYLKNCRDNGRIPMNVNPCGCNTMRVRHSVVANVPRVTSFYGKELRSVFAVPEQKVLVGSDIAGLEACILAHYLGDKEFIDFIIKEDFKYHKFFFNILKNYVSSYDICKNLDFAFIFGGGDYKLGTMCDLVNSRNPSHVGAEVRKIMIKNIPGLEQLQSLLNSQYEKYNGIIGLDGRLIKVRKKSALINTACQSGGALIAKYWTCKVEQVKKDIPSNLVIFYHDELAYETDKENALPLGKLMVDCIKWSGEYLKLKIPLTGSYKIGNSWGDVH